MGRFDRYVARLASLIVERPGTIVVVFLLITAGLAPGMGMLETEAGTDQFIEDVPEFDAQERVNEEFEPAFGDSTQTTQLIHRGDNVLNKRGLLSMLETLETMSDRTDMRARDTSAAARTVAQELDPEATTLEEEIEAIEGSSDGDIQRTVRQIGDDPGFTATLSDDYSAESAEARAAIGVVTHEFPESDSDELQRIQLETVSIADSADDEIIVFGSGILNQEFENVIFDSLAIVVPAALGFILILLIAAYRDPIDFLLGTAALLMTVIWTFGFTGLAGIPFTDVLIAVPVLLLAIGIDFGIHAINRYREERQLGNSIDDSMRIGISQLFVAFFIIALTTLIGFFSNLVNDLGPIQEFGLVAGIGMIFTLAIFGLFLPASKVLADRIRERTSFPTFSTTPLGQEESILGRILPIVVTVSKPSPVVFMLVVLVLTAGAAGYGAGVDTTFDDEDFLPPETEPAYVQYLPEIIQPGEYTVTATLNFLEDNFETGQDDEITIYIEGRFAADHALEALVRPEEDPPGTFVERGGTGETTSILDAIDGLAAEDPTFDALVTRNDRSGNDIPDRELDVVYEELFASDFDGFAEQYLTDDRRSTRVIYEVEADADDAAITEDARMVADRYRGDAIATGQIIIFQAVEDIILESAIESLIVALSVSAVFLVLIFRALTGSAGLGVINLVPVAVTVATLLAVMRFLDVPLNALTATVLAITIGLGVDYAVHLTHRFHDEYEMTGELYPSIERTMRGTGGALTATVLTTALGTGVLYLAITPILGLFGLVTALSISIAYLSSILLLPACMIIHVAVSERRWGLLIGRSSVQ